MNACIHRTAAVALAATALSLTSGAQLVSSTPTGEGLAAFGPLSPDNGFPEWYEDLDGTRLRLCLSNNGLCLLPAPVNLVNPALAFPNNYGGTFPDEGFWWACDASMPTNNGGQALLVMALEMTFNPTIIADGNQTSFARLRLRVDNLIAGQTYDVVTPLGAFTFVAENSATRGINFTEDTGLIALDFATPLGGNVGPFLRWDSELPIFDIDGNEYIGDPNIPHSITGSATPFFQISGPSVGGPGVNSIETQLFNVMGMLADAVAPVAPVANFSASPTSGAGPLDVAFTDLSTDTTSWSWDFGDGGTSTLQNPAHTYVAPGTYTVSLTASGPGGMDTNTMPGLIVVNAIGGPATTLLPPDPGVAGVRNRLTVVGATPGGRVVFFMSTTLGMQTLSGGGCTVDMGILSPKRLGGARADASGTASISARVPAGFAGMTAHLQAVDVSACTPTNIVSHTF